MQKKQKIFFYPLGTLILIFQRSSSRNKNSCEYKYTSLKACNGPLHVKRDSANSCIIIITACINITIHHHQQASLSSSSRKITITITILPSSSSSCISMHHASACIIIIIIMHLHQHASITIIAIHHHHERETVAMQPLLLPFVHVSICLL